MLRAPTVDEATLRPGGPGSAQAPCTVPLRCASQSLYTKVLAGGEQVSPERATVVPASTSTRRLDSLSFPAPWAESQPYPPRSPPPTVA